jgi:transposase
VPRQHSTGDKAKLYGISKRGNIYLRRMFVHGARAVLLRVKYDTGSFGQWVHQFEARAPRNKVIVAIANKLARIAWIVGPPPREASNSSWLSFFVGRSKHFQSVRIS